MLFIFRNAYGHFVSVLVFAFYSKILSLFIKILQRQNLHHGYTFFSNHGLTTKTKIIVFRAVVHLSTLLYACKTWTLYCQDIKRLEQFQQSSEESFTSMRSSLGHLYPASRLPSFKITYTEWVTCPECVPLNSHVSFCLEDSPATRGYPEAQNDTSRIS